MYHEVMGLDAMILVFLIFSFKLTLSFSSFNLIERLFSSSLLSAIIVVSFFSIALRYEAKREVFHKGELKGEIKEREAGEKRS